MSDTGRTFEMEIAIDADPENVWKALTEARELTRWFPPAAEVSPGPEGRIRLSWGEGALTGNCPVLAWEPERRLKMTWWERPEAANALVADFLIEARGGRTVLRLVHSGFGSDASWDDEYDSIGRGWSFELRSLKHYLERFRGKDRRLCFRRLPVTDEIASAWSRLVGARGVFAVSALERLHEGVSFTLELPSGGSTAATLIYQLADRDFAAALEVLGDGILRLGFETFSGQPEVWVWLASWELAQSQLERMMEQWIPRIESAVSGKHAV